jgi:hypothetical protein
MYKDPFSKGYILRKEFGRIEIVNFLKIKSKIFIMIVSKVYK